MSNIRTCATLSSIVLHSVRHGHCTAGNQPVSNMDSLADEKSLVVRASSPMSEDREGLHRESPGDSAQEAPGSSQETQRGSTHEASPRRPYPEGPGKRREAGVGAILGCGTGLPRPGFFRALRRWLVSTSLPFVCQMLALFFSRPGLTAKSVDATEIYLSSQWGVKLADRKSAAALSAHLTAHCCYVL